MLLNGKKIEIIGEGAFVKIDIGAGDVINIRGESFEISTVEPTDTDLEETDEE